MRNDYIKAFETLVHDFIKHYEAQGLVIGIFDQKEMLYQASYGYRDVEKKLPIDGETIFGIASITKSFTIIRIMQLVEEGRLDLNTSISELYPNWQLSEAHTPTVKQLMSHIAGFYPQERFLMKDVAEELNVSDCELTESLALSDKGIEMIIERLNSTQSFNGAPGERFSYSNFSFGILTDLVQRYSDESTYSGAVMEHIIKPLGLERTFFDFTRPSNEDNVTKLYTVTDEGIDVTDDYTDLGFVLLGGGALKSTLNDLVTYTRMYLNKGTGHHRILTENSIQEMTQERTSYKEHQGYAYGLVTGDLDGLEYVGHSGGLTGVSSFFGFTPSSNRGVVILCNTGGVAVTAMGLAALRLANDAYPDYKVGVYETSCWSPQIIEQTIGLYESDEGDKVQVLAHGDTVCVIANGKRLSCRIIRDDLLLIQNKLEERYCKILRSTNGQAFALYLGSRIIPFKVKVSL